MVVKSETEYINYQIAQDLGYSWLRDPDGNVKFVSFQWKNKHESELAGWTFGEEPEELSDVPEYDKNPQLLYSDYCLLIKALRDSET